MGLSCRFMLYTFLHGINGRETYQQIIKIRPGQKAVIASGYAKTKEVDMAQELEK
jgi:two-component system, cell cycle sensor histidine kinase and response regulator CckA